MEEKIKEYIETHLDPSHESAYRRGSWTWSDSKWIAVISYKIEFPKARDRHFHRRVSSLIRKHVATVKSQLLNK